MKKRLNILTLLFILACSRPEREPAIKPDVPRFFQVYLTFLQLNEADSTGLVDQSVLMDSALAQHNMAAEQFDSTLSYLERNPELFLQAFEMFDDSLRTLLQIKVPD